MSIIPKKISHKLMVNILIVSLIMIIGVLGAYFGTLKLSYEHSKDFLHSHLETAYKTIDFVYKTEGKRLDEKVKEFLNNKAHTVIQKLDEIYAKYQNKEITLDEAKNEISKYILSIKIGKTGYGAITNANGVILFHPAKKIIGKSIVKILKGGKEIVEWVKQQNQTAIGKILKYYWRNPGDKYAKPKVLIPIYYAPLNWIIFITAYKSEILLYTKARGIDIRKFLRGLKIGKRGYFYIINGDGIFVLHPKYEGENIKKFGKVGKMIAETMIKEKKGIIEYEWEGLKKFAIFKYYAPLDWYIAISGYYVDLIEGKEIYIYFPTIIEIFVLIYIFIFGIFQRKQILKPTNKIIALIKEAEKGNIKALYPFKKISCSRINNCHNTSCEYYNKEQNECFYKIGSFATEYGGKARAERTYSSCEICPVYKKSVETEFDEIGLWITLLLTKIIKMSEVLNSLQKLAKMQSQKLTSDSERLNELETFLDTEFQKLEKNLQQAKENIANIKQSSEEEEKRVSALVSDAGEVSNAIRKSGEMSHYFSEEFEKLKKSFNEEIEILKKTVEYITSLEKDYEKVREIVKFIKDIAAETSLLSLNASIEAARAGEKGKGFAVVADEISKLSVQTQESSQEISELIEESIERGLKGIKFVETLQQKLKQMIDNTTEIVETATPIFQSNVENAEQIEKMKNIIEDIKKIFINIKERAEIQFKFANENISYIKIFREKLGILHEISKALNTTSEGIKSYVEEFTKILDFFRVK